MRPLSLFDDPSGPARPLGLIGRTMMMAIAGELVTEAFEYDDGRPVTVYVPPDSPQGIVFAGDGQLISQWGGVLEAADVPATMIVGAHRLDHETLRLQEYSPGSNRGGSRLTSSSSSTKSAGGCGRASESRCLPNAPRCSVCRRAESLRSRWGFDTRISTVRSSALRRAVVTDPLV